MARKNDSPQKAAMREMMRDMMSILLEGALDEERGYSKEYHFKQLFFITSVNAP